MIKFKNVLSNNYDSTQVIQKLNPASSGTTYSQRGVILFKAIFIIFVLAFGVSKPEMLRAESFPGNCKMCGNVRGTYYWGKDRNGNKTTTFVSDDGTWYIEKKGGHTTFAVDNDEDEPVLPLPIDPTLTANVTFATAPSEIIIETDKPIIVKLVNVSTGSFITEDIDIELTGSINTSQLPAGCSYGIAVYQVIPDIGRVHNELYLFYKD